MPSTDCGFRWASFSVLCRHEPQFLENLLVCDFAPLIDGLNGNVAAEFLLDDGLLADVIQGRNDLEILSPVRPDSVYWPDIIDPVC